MYICAEGVSAYELIYNSRGIAPKCVAIIQPGEGFGGNWTDFHKVDAPLYQALKRNPSGLPEMIINGGVWERDWDHGYETFRGMSIRSLFTTLSKNFHIIGPMKP